MRPPGTALTVTGLTLRRTWRGALGVAATNVLVTATAVLGYEATYPDPADRTTLATSIGSNPGLIALFGETRALETVAGFTEWRVVLILAVVGAVWMLFATARVLRGEEEAGRWEVVLAGAITPLRATVAALAGLSVALLILLLGTLLGLLASTGSSLGADHAALLALTLASTPALMLGVAALTSQLAQTRRRAVTLGAAVLGLSYLVRVAADSSPDLRWLRWATPLGWLELAHPLTEPSVIPVVLSYLLAGLFVGLALSLVGSRDTGAGLLAEVARRPDRTRGLSSPLGLAMRLGEGSAWSWGVGLALAGALIGLVARTAAEAMAQSSGGGLFSDLGIEDSGTRAYVGVFYLFITVALAVAAAGQVSATREEEATGRLDDLLARPVGPGRWLAGRVTAALGLLVLGAAAAVLGTWASSRAGGLGVPAGDLAVAGANTLPAAVLILGAGTLLHGLVPRLAGPLTYLIVTGSFLLEVVGASVNLPSWILNLSVLHHVAPAPAVDPRWDAAAVLLVLGLGLAVLGGLALGRRDIEPA